MITIDLSEVTKFIREKVLEEAIQERLEEVATDIFVDLAAPPPLGTPVDTGFARNGWQIDLSDPTGPQITNSVVYIGKLNDGHSKQSPAGFVDAIIDKNVR